jgi:hypothetical protein
VHKSATSCIVPAIVDYQYLEDCSNMNKKGSRIQKIFPYIGLKFEAIEIHFKFYSESVPSKVFDEEDTI